MPTSQFTSQPISQPALQPALQRVIRLTRYHLALTLFSFIMMSLSYCTQPLAASAPMTIKALVQQASLIAVVKVQLATPDQTNSTTANLQIEELLKAPDGFSASFVKVQSFSRIVPSNSTRFVIANENHYIPEERAVVFLRAVSDGGIYKTVQGSLGRLPIVGGRVSPENILLDDYIKKIRAIQTEIPQ